MTLQLREYATLSCDGAVPGSMDCGRVSPSTFEWLLELHQGWSGQAPLLQRHGARHLKLGSWVGYLQSPSGEAIEILPKTQSALPGEGASRRMRLLLREMLATSLGLKPREAGSARLERVSLPLHEWILGRFLDELNQLVRRGLRFDYRRVEEESRYVRGQLNMARQMRQTPERAARFHIRHDLFSPNRMENRLLRTTLDLVLKLTQDSDHWRQANALQHQLLAIEPVARPLTALSQWQSGRLMAPYESIRPWCQLILERLNPSFQQGAHRGIALLFPMERLFEDFVSHHLSRQLRAGARLEPQVARRHLVVHRPEGEKSANWFQLKPDLLLSCGGRQWVLDTKWKLLNASDRGRDRKYGIKQDDLYQLFAYGHQYLGGTGELMLIYPGHGEFQRPLPVFEFSPSLRLWAVPFDLDRPGLVGGDWQDRFPGLASVPDESPAAATGHTGD